MRRVRAAAAVAVLLCPRGAHAQVNTETLRKRIHDKGFSLVVEGTFDGHTGNTRGLTADGLVGIGYARDRHLAFAFASADYSRLNGTVGIDKSFAHLRYDYELAGWSWWEVFAQAQSDLFQRIKIRNLSGTGPRFALYQDRQLGLFVGAAYMFEVDVIDAAPGTSGDQRVTAHRTSSYLSAQATLSDGIEAVTTSYLQPRIDDPSDLRVLSESGFVFKMNKVFSTRLTFTAHYDSRPPSGVLPTDTELKDVLSLAF
jgi:hypothetical protein